MGVTNRVQVRFWFPDNVNAGSPGEPVDENTLFEAFGEVRIDDGKNVLRHRADETEIGDGCFIAWISDYAFYQCDEAMLAASMSDEFRGWLIEVQIEYPFESEFERRYYRSGLMQVCSGEIVYAKFDPSAFKPKVGNLTPRVRTVPADIVKQGIDPHE